MIFSAEGGKILHFQVEGVMHFLKGVFAQKGAKIVQIQKNSMTPPLFREIGLEGGGSSRLISPDCPIALGTKEKLRIWKTLKHW